MQQDIVERARRGDVEAFGQLAEGHGARLRTMARLILRDADLAEDAVQEALLRCWRQLPKLRDADRFDAWLTRTLIRTASDEAARRRRFEASVRPITAERSQSDDLSVIGIREQLDRGFRRLSVDHRAVVVLHHYSGLTLSEVASVLGVAPGTIRSRYHYAMSALRAAIEADERGATNDEVLA